MTSSAIESAHDYLLSYAQTQLAQEDEDKRTRTFGRRKLEERWQISTTSHDAETLGNYEYLS